MTILFKAPYTKPKPRKLTNPIKIGPGDEAWVVRRRINREGATEDFLEQMKVHVVGDTAFILRKGNQAADLHPAHLCFKRKEDAVRYLAKGHKMWAVVHTHSYGHHAIAIIQVLAKRIPHFSSHSGRYEENYEIIPFDKNDIPATVMAKRRRRKRRYSSGQDYRFEVFKTKAKAIANVREHAMREYKEYKRKVVDCGKTRDKAHRVLIALQDRTKKVFNFEALDDC